MYLAAFLVKAQTEITGTKEIAQQIPKIKGFGINSSLGKCRRHLVMLDTIPAAAGILLLTLLDTSISGAFT